MDATQMISDSFLESDDEENEEENENERGQPLAKLCILKNKHIPETELPLYLGDNVLGRDPSTCTLPLLASSVSKQHATICISVFRRKGSDSEVDTEAVVWDLGSMNGTRKGRLKLTPNVRYALSEGDNLVVADIPCQYVSYTANEAPCQGNARTPECKSNGVTAKVPDGPEDSRSDVNRSIKKLVNEDQKARLSLPEDRRNIPVRNSCLSFEQTPTHPQASLVPESDSDSDGERGGAGERRRKAQVSNSESFKSSPSCSSFLSPANKIVPESEDESPITPSSSTKNRPDRHVSFSKEETHMDVGRQELKEKEGPAIVDDSEEDGEREEERATQSGIKPKEHVPFKVDGDVSLTGENASSPAAATNAIPAFNLDSDTDVEGEEDISAGPVTLDANQKADQPADQFHLDSDTDVDEDDNALEKVPKSMPANTKPPHVMSMVQPEDITMDSDTDVDDDAVSGPAAEAKPVPFQSTADSAVSTSRKDFHLESDTDVDEEEERGSGADSKIEGTATILPGKSELEPAGPLSSHFDSDTDNEAVPAVSKSSASCTAADKAADLEILSDSDTDVEDKSPPAKPAAGTSVSGSPSTKSVGLQPDSDADTDADESSAPPIGKGGSAAGLGLDSDTDVEDKEEDFGVAGEGQIPSLCREITPGPLAPVLQSCSTPAPTTEERVEDMNTQAFFSPSTGPFRRQMAASRTPKTLPSLSDSNEDDDFVVAETQSFVSQTKGGQSSSEDPIQTSDLDSSGVEKTDSSITRKSVQLGLFDSSHLQDPAQALAMESTQAFVSVEGAVTLEETQAYAANSNTDRPSSENVENLEATQEYREEEDEEGKDTEGLLSKKEGQEDFAMEATQAYISEPHCESEEETDEEDAETQPLDIPFSSTLAMAETQPVTAFEEEVDTAEDNLPSEVKHMPRNETGEEGPKLQEMLSNKALNMAQTQPMSRSEDEENDDDDDSIIISRKRTAKPLLPEDEQTQPFTNSELSPVENQPTGAAEGADSDEEDPGPGPRKRKAKRLHIQDEESQTLTTSELSAVETQPMVTAEDEESDEEDSIFSPRRRSKARKLESQEEESQPLSEASSVKMQPSNSKKSNAGASGVSSRGKRGTRTMLREEEQQEETPEPPQRRTRGVKKTQSNVKGRNGNLRLDEDEREEEKEVEQAKRTRGRKSMKQQKEEEMAKEKLEIERKKLEKLEKERQEKEEQERLEAENAEKLRLEKEQAEKERIKQEKKEQEEKKRLEHDKAKREEKGREAKEEKEQADRERKEKEEQLERERKEKLEKERLEQEKAEREKRDRLQREEKEIKEKEEKERAEIAKKEKEEQLERERKERIEKERIEKEKKEKERLETAKRVKESKEREEKERLERERNENDSKEKKVDEKENKTETPARGRRAARRTIAAPSTTQDSNILADDDVPARRTRSRSNSSNSVSSERSAASVNTQESRGRGRGRGAKRTSEPPPAATARSSTRRRTVAAVTKLQESDVSPQEALSMSNSSNSLNSEISSCSTSSQSRGRGGRGRKLERDSVLSNSSQTDQTPAPKPAARGRKSRKAEESLTEAPDNSEEKADSQQASTTRGQQRANTSSFDTTTAEEENPSTQESSTAEESPHPKRNVRGRGQKHVTSESKEVPAVPPASDEDEGKRRGRKRQQEESPEEPGSSSKVPKWKEKTQTTEAKDENATSETKGESSFQAKRRGRASSTQAKNSQGSQTEEKKMEEELVVRKVRGRPSVVQKEKEKQEESGSSVEQDSNLEASEPQTPASILSQKRQASADASPVAKTPRSSSASPAAGGRSRAASQAYKVLFTGVVDEAGEKVLARLGGSMAKGVADMNCLVTDKVRRTVKFLCAVAKGVPIVTTHWLEKSGKAGSFRSPDAFVVKDPEQEKKFNFCLQESLRIASSQLLLKGYEIHVTKSVKPEPLHMKDIITCSGATFLPKMPSSHKPQTIVISCEEDLSLCGPALAVSVPVVSAEFILTGILQQKLDLQTYSLSASASNLQTAGGRGRGRKKT